MINNVFVSIGLPFRGVLRVAHCGMCAMCTCRYLTLCILQNDAFIGSEIPNCADKYGTIAMGSLIACQKE
jgi:uncharacterized ferredoxin-like protein